MVKVMCRCGRRTKLTDRQAFDVWDGRYDKECRWCKGKLEKARVAEAMVEEDYHSSTAAAPSGAAAAFEGGGRS